MNFQKYRLRHSFFISKSSQISTKFRQKFNQILYPCTIFVCFFCCFFAFLLWKTINKKMRMYKRCDHFCIHCLFYAAHTIANNFQQYIAVIIYQFELNPKFDCFNQIQWFLCLLKDTSCSFQIWYQTLQLVKIIKRYVRFKLIYSQYYFHLIISIKYEIWHCVHACDIFISLINPLSLFISLWFCKIICILLNILAMIVTIVISVLDAYMLLQIINVLLDW